MAPCRLFERSEIISARHEEQDDGEQRDRGGTGRARGGGSTWRLVRARLGLEGVLQRQVVEEAAEVLAEVAPRA